MKKFLISLMTATIFLSLVSCSETEPSSQQNTLPQDFAVSQQNKEEAPDMEETSPDMEETTPDIEESTGKTQRELRQEESMEIFIDSSTLEGEPVDSTVFADYDLTMVNIWATWCGPCVNEMPYLQEVYEQMPTNVNFFSICGDATGENPTATAILDASGAEFQTLIASTQVQEEIMSMIQAYPTTIFVDREGYLVYAMQGAPSSDVTEAYLNILYSLLEFLDAEV